MMDILLVERHSPLGSVFTPRPIPFNIVAAWFESVVYGESELLIIESLSDFLPAIVLPPFVFSSVIDAALDLPPSALAMLVASSLKVDFSSMVATALDLPPSVLAMLVASSLEKDVFPSMVDAALDPPPSNLAMLVSSSPKVAFSSVVDA
eukprot:9665956-Ditylum_brightwellii.AAC.1